MIQYLSPSALATWETCPRQTFFKRLMRLPEGPSDPVPRDVGSAAHAIFQALYALEPELRDRRAAIQMIAYDAEATWRETYPESIEAVGLPAFERAVTAAVYGLFEIENPPEVQVMLTERRVQTEIAGVPVLCIIDRVVRSRRGFEPEDYKTGKLKRDISGLTDQLTINALALEEVGVDDDVTQGAGLFTVAKRRVNVSIDLCMKVSMRGRLQRAWDEIGEMFETGEMPAAKPGKRWPCEWCPWSAPCPDAFSE